MKKNNHIPSSEINLKLVKDGKYSVLDNGLTPNRQNIKKIKLDENGEILFVKSLDAERAIASTAASQMYSQIGINTPAVEIFRNSTDAKSQRSTIQPDVTQNNNFEIILAKNDLEYKKIFLSFSTRYKWQLLYDMDLQEKFLSYMTPQCLDSLINMYLIDELRSDSDRHLSNYFLYKKPDSKLYEGIIAIDLDQMQIFNYAPTSKTEFTTFLTNNYTSMTPTQREDSTNFANRIYMLRELIYDGVLSSSNIETMVKALKHDFPNDVKLLCKNQKLSHKLINKTHSTISRLWDYNQNELGKDLGL